MKKKWRDFLLFFLVLFSNLFIIKSNIIIANPLAVPEYRYSGGLLPPENVSLSLVSAKVVIDADTSNLRYLGKISFKGNYTILNSGNDLNITIAAPFNINPENNLTVLINNTLVPSDILYSDELQSELWLEYVENISTYFLTPRYWILSNISIAKNDTTDIYYEFNHPEPIYSRDLVSFDIIYDVGTARLWNGTITEKVEIKTHGYNPRSIYNEDLCQISDILDGKSHTWEWVDERIEIDIVGVYYYYWIQDEYEQIYFNIKIMLILTVSILGIVSIIVKILYSRKNKKRS
ncbi:MAG: hypothetical protein ACFFEY_03860 [Candidatus Thorarchaeota archaeon]